MEDSRLPESGKNVSESFKKVLKIRSSNFVGITRIESLQTVNTGHSSMATKTSPQNSVDARKLLFELHIQMRKEECPVFSMIFVRTRIFLLMDWIRQFQTFLLLNSEFRPPSNPAENENFDALLLQSTLSLFEMPKKGVILRTISPSSTRLQQKLSGAAKNTQNTIKETRIVEKDISGKFSMKITLKDCELIALEDPRREDTFALIALTTGVILCDNLKKNELLEFQYEIQQFSLHWCSMRRDNAETGLCTQLTNETSATIVISYEHKEKKAVAISDSNNQPLLLNEKQRCLPPQIILTQIGPLIIRGSLKDYFIVKNIYDSAYALWENAQEINFFWANLTEEAIQVETIAENLLFPTEFAVPVKMPQSHLASQQKFVLNADSLCIWILKETVGGVNEKKECVGEGSIAPFLRININEMNLQSTNFTTKIRLLLAMDYYRELVAPLGWEPLLEKWQIANFIAAFTEQGNWSLIIKGAEDCLMELNLTQIFIQEFLDFQAEDIQTIWEIFNAPDNEGLEKLRNKGYSRAIITDSEDHPKTASESDYIPEKFTKNVGDGKLYTNLLAKKIIDPKAQFSNQGISIDLQIDLDAGIGISLIGNDEQNEDTDKNSEQHQEELIYARLTGVRANLQKRRHIYQLGCCINSISMDNQIFGADRFNFFFCDPNALRDEPVSGPLPALNFEMSYSCSEFWDAYESFRLKLCNSCILLDEQLFWRLINFGINVYFHRAQKDSEQKELPEITRNCYFGVFQLELGEISLSVMTIDKNILPSKLRTLKDAYSDKFVLFSFENAAVNLSPFWAHRCYTTLGNLFANVGDFYISELKRQKLNILISMDAFGNPIGFVNELKEGAEGLLFEGDLAGFTFGIGYGAANSISKMASSLAKGVGTLTFDEQHEQLRRKMLRSKPDESNALTHLYGGLKGFGVGVFGALTAIPKNTITATKQDGITGVFRGVTTGAVDTLTKPLQGAFDFIEGTASAIKEVVGAPLVRRAHFPKNRLRLARVCSSLNGLLPPQYSYELAIGQQELLRITGAFTLNDENRLLCIVNFLERLSADRTSRILHRALICLTRCYILREVDEQSTVNYRILYQNLRKVQLANQQQEQHQTSQFKPSTTNKNHHAAGNIGGTSTRMTAVEVFYHQSASDKSKEQMKASTSTSNFYHRLSAKPTQTSSQTPALTLWCADRQTAQQLCKQIMKAKAQFDRRGIGKGMRTDQQQQTTSKKKLHSSSIFTI